MVDSFVSNVNMDMCLKDFRGRLRPLYGFWQLIVTNLLSWHTLLYAKEAQLHSNAHKRTVMTVTQVVQSGDRVAQLEQFQSVLDWWTSRSVSDKKTDYIGWEKWEQSSTEMCILAAFFAFLVVFLASWGILIPSPVDFYRFSSF